jgi:Ca2+-binding RTX toxin-like protein
MSGNTGGPTSAGGGLATDFGVRGEIKVVNSTISGNTASKGGGASIGDNDANPGKTGSIEFDNSTIADNDATAANKGGGIYLGKYNASPADKSPTIPLNSTIVADNRAAGAAQDLDRDDDSAGGGFDLAFSLVERRGDAPIISSGPNLIGVDPKLGPLAANGGPTRTQKPTASSKVIDKGDSSRLPTDQRGQPRPVNLGLSNALFGNGTDIGAVELRRSELPNGGKCAGKDVTIIGSGRKIKGTNGPDVILGTNGKNVIRGRGGKDVICGLGGKDRLIGGGGPDRLLGGKGKDTLIGGPGRDKLKGGPGADNQRQ